MENVFLCFQSLLAIRAVLFWMTVMFTEYLEMYVDGPCGRGTDNHCCVLITALAALDRQPWNSKYTSLRVRPTSCA